MDYLHQLTTKFIHKSSEHEIHDVNRKQYNNTVDSDTSVCQWIILFVTDRVNFKCKIYESKESKEGLQAIDKTGDMISGKNYIRQYKEHTIQTHDT